MVRFEKLFIIYIIIKYYKRRALGTILTHTEILAFIQTDRHTEKRTWLD